MSIEAGLCKYAELNDKIKQELRTKKKVTITAVNGQRYIGCALDAGKTIQVHGTPGNDMACYLNGGKVEVFGNCQDAVGNTMNGGEIVIHGHAGDAMGYGMRDGQIFVETNVACRGGIHMKEFEQMKPVLVIGRNAGSFLGEYMAGGTIVLLGLGMKRGEKLFGTHCASGMHGGKIFVRGSFPKENISPNIKVTALTDADRQELEGYLKKYCKYFGVSMDEIMKNRSKSWLPPPPDLTQTFTRPTNGIIIEKRATTTRDRRERCSIVCTRNAVFSAYLKIRPPRWPRRRTWLCLPCSTEDRRVAALP